MYMPKPNSATRVEAKVTLKNVRFLSHSSLPRGREREQNVLSL